MAKKKGTKKAAKGEKGK